MGLASLFLFTLLGGLAAGLYVAETFLRRTREGERTWLVPVAVVVLFAAGLIAAATHINSIPRAFESLFCGTVNFASGMIWEVAVSALFLILAAIDMALALMKKQTPFALRAVAAVVAVAALVLMGTAYINVYGNPVWTNAPATVLTFVAGGLAMGIAAYAMLAKADYAAEKTLRSAAFIMSAVLAVALALEIAAFMSAGCGIMLVAMGLIVAPVVSMALVALAEKIDNKNMLAIAVFAAMFVGVAMARWAFYATSAVL